MTGDEYGRLAYLILLLIAVGGWFVAESRRNMGRNLRMAVIWGLIFLGVAAGYGLWGDLRNDILPRQSVVGSGVIEVPAGPDGHYHLTLDLNGSAVGFVVDTGASDVVLTRADAARIGLDLAALDFSQTATTANGRVATAPAVVQTVTLGDITDRRLAVSVNGGEMNESLLGMSYLSRFRSIEIRGNRLILTR